MKRKDSTKGPTDDQRRWGSEKGSRMRLEIYELLKEGNVAGIIDVLRESGDGHDLRGFPFSIEIDRSRDIFHGTKCANGLFTEFDFSESDFTMSGWRDCEFHNCTFKQGIWNQTFFAGCVFKNCLFEDFDFNLVSLGQGTIRNPGRISNTIFRKGRFREVSFDYPLIENCTFDCDISRTDFHGSRFENCAFSGRLKGVFFNGRAKPYGERLSLLPDGLVPENKMINVDFRMAKMEEVEFRQGVDLSKCLFPEEVVFIPDAPKTLRNVLQVVENWEGMDLEFGLMVVKGMLDHIEYRGDQKQLAINVEAKARLFKRLWKFKGDLPTKELRELLKSM
jgi:uncharacterized protein YjbI with pentapeptide repeats